MKKEFDRILKMSLISWIAFIILGIFLFTKAELTLKVISYIVGGTLLLAIIPLVKTLISKDAIYNYSFISEIFMVVAGLIIVLNTELIASIIPILIGIVMIINGVSKIQFACVLKKENLKSWTISLLLAIVITCCGIIFITNPFKGAVTITKVIGIVIILYSILDMFDFLFINKNVKKEGKTETKEIKIIEEEN